MQLFTTAEAANYLRLKERKIYEMVAEGTVPCTKVTGRWLFPKAELDHWLASSISRPEGMAGPEPSPIVGGSHDPLLEWALRESGSGLATLAVGSEAGFARFNASDMQDAVMIAFCRREQGFLVAPGNPLKIGSIEDAAAKHARVAMRPAGAGAQLLLLALLHRAKITQESIVTAGPVCPTGPDIAQAIRAGRADTGIATRSVASSAGLDFISIVWEPFDLVMRQRDFFRSRLGMKVDKDEVGLFAQRFDGLAGDREGIIQRRLHKGASLDIQYTDF